MCLYQDHFRNIMFITFLFTFYFYNMNFRPIADSDCRYYPPVDMLRIVPGKYTWSTEKYPSNDFAILKPFKICLLTCIRC